MNIILPERLSRNFTIEEFCNTRKYPDNTPSMQQAICMAYGCLMILEPARLIVGPIIINSGFRNKRVNTLVGGVETSQHMLGQAVDIRPKNPSLFPVLVDYLKNNPRVDQLLTGNGWLHVSWNPFFPPRNDIRLNYYK